MPYRHTEGFVRFLSGFAVEGGMQAPDYSTINGMVNRLRVDLGDSLVKSKGPVSVAVDASGIKVHNRRDWIRRAWKVRKGYLKIRFAVDIKTGEVVPTDATPEKVGNGRRLRRLVGDAEGRSGSGGPSPTALTTEGEPQLPRGGQSQSSGSGRERPRAEEGGACEEAGCHRTAEAQAEGVVRNPRVRIQMEDRGGLLGDKGDIRGVRHCGEVRQHGEGDDNESVHIQHVYRADPRPPAGGQPGEGPLGHSPGGRATQHALYKGAPATQESS